MEEILRLLIRGEGMFNHYRYDARLKQFENIRKKMISAATANGLKHPQVLKYSQELDYLHNMMLMHEKIQRNKKMVNESTCLLIDKRIDTMKE